MITSFFSLFPYNTPVCLLLTMRFSSTFIQFHRLYPFTKIYLPSFTFLPFWMAYPYLPTILNGLSTFPPPQQSNAIQPSRFSANIRKNVWTSTSSAIQSPTVRSPAMRSTANADRTSFSVETGAVSGRSSNAMASTIAETVRQLQQNLLNKLINLISWNSLRKLVKRFVVQPSSPVRHL